MRYTHHPIDGVAITLDDLRIFLDEMTGYRGLPGTAVVRGRGGPMEIDFDASGPRLRNLTAQTDDGPAAAPAAEHAQPESTQTGAE